MSRLRLTTQLWRWAKLKISHWFYWLVFLAYQVFIVCQKNILSNRFATLFTRWQPLTEVFIFNHKSSCCNGTFAINIAANKECLKKRRIVLKYIDSAFLQLYCLKFSSTLVDIFELRKIMKGVLLFWNTV